MKLGSHNSWSFGKTDWYIPTFTCKCQNLNIQEQYNLGVRLFDLRLRLKKKVWYPAHGSACFKCDFIKDLKWLNEKGDCYVRLMLEYNSKPKNSNDIVETFDDYCTNLENTYNNIKFFGGRKKWDWTSYAHTCKNPEETLIDRYSSTTSFFSSTNKLLRISDDWWPYLYAKCYNKDNYKKYKDSSDWLFIDFVEYGRS